MTPFLKLFLGGAVAFLAFFALISEDQENYISSIWVRPERIAATSSPAMAGEATITASSTAAKKTPAKTAPLTPTPAAVIAPAIPTYTAPELPVTPSVPAPNPAELNLRAREAVVNILCVTKSSGSFQPISGSGVIIDSHGIILTNAHVAQYFLLKDFQVPNFIDCTIRTGSPAYPAYKAELIYLSPRWLKENAAAINSYKPEGTGENDFALLRITQSAQADRPLPDHFTALPANTRYNGENPEKGVLLVSYPAELLGGILTQVSLNQVSSLGSIQHGFYFKDANAGLLDSFSLGGNIVAQGGSSGGAVIDSSTGTLVGILVTSTSADSTASKDLHALSLAHIDRSMLQETGRSLASYLSKSPAQLQSEFTATFLELKSVLQNAILGISEN